jgi:hypothetical protein
MLLSPQIFTTVEITTKFELTQNAVKIQARLDKGALYIIEDQTRLNIYVPKSSRDKELCYRRLLLSRLLAKLMRGEGAITTTHFDPRAFGIVANIIICSDLIIEDILEDAGIIRVSFPAAYVSYTVPETLSGMPEPKRYASGSDVLYQKDLTLRRDYVRPNTTGQRSNLVVIHPRLRRPATQPATLVFEPNSMSLL